MSLVIQILRNTSAKNCDKKGKEDFQQRRISEDWCFECKDRGELMICDYGQVLLLTKNHFIFGIFDEINY